VRTILIRQALSVKRNLLFLIIKQNGENIMTTILKSYENLEGKLQNYPVEDIFCFETILDTYEDEVYVENAIYANSKHYKTLPILWKKVSAYARKIEANS